MKPMKLLKLSAAGLLILAIVLAISSFLVPEIVPTQPLNTAQSYSQMSAYVASLEAFSQTHKVALSCNVSREGGSQFQDQWQQDLRCTMDEGSLYIRSAGLDGKFDNKDDLIVRRVVRSR